MAAFLRQVCGREVDGDPLGRQRKAHGSQRGLHPLPAFGHGLVRQADHGEARHPCGELALHLHLARVEAKVGNRLN